MTHLVRCLALTAGHFAPAPAEWQATAKPPVPAAGQVRGPGRKEVKLPASGGHEARAE